MLLINIIDCNNNIMKVYKINTKILISRRKTLNIKGFKICLQIHCRKWNKGEYYIDIW